MRRLQLAVHCAFLAAIGAAMLLSVGCRTPKEAFERIELGKPLPADCLPYGSRVTTLGAGHARSWLWLLPLINGVDNLRVLRNDQGDVIAKSYYFVEGIHWGLFKTGKRAYVLEFDVPEGYFREPLPDGERVKMFEAAFPLNSAYVEKLMAGMSSGNLLVFYPEPKPAPKAASLVDAAGRLEGQLSEAYRNNGGRELPQDVATCLVLTVMLLETYGFDRAQEDACEVCASVVTWPRDVIEMLLKNDSVVFGGIAEPHHENVLSADCDAGDGLRSEGAIIVRHLEGRRIRIIYAEAVGAGAADALATTRPAG